MTKPKPKTKTTEAKNRRAPVRGPVLEPQARERLEGLIDPKALDEALSGLDDRADHRAGRPA